MTTIPQSTTRRPKPQTFVGQSTVFLDQAAFAFRFPTEVNFLWQCPPLPLESSLPGNQDSIEFLRIQPSFADQLKVQGGTPRRSPREGDYPDSSAKVELEDNTAIIECLIAVRCPNRPTCVQFVSNLFHGEPENSPGISVRIKSRPEVCVRNGSSIGFCAKGCDVLSTIPNPLTNSVEGTGQPRRIRFLDAIA